MNFLSRSHFRLQAFSMVELLATVAIIGILASLIVPQASRMVERGQSAKCVSSLKNISTAIHAYTADNDGKMPATGSKSNATSPSDNLIGNWYDDIAPYFGKDSIGTVGQVQMDKVYDTVSCPTFRKKYKGERPTWVGYGMNTRLNLSINSTSSTSSKRPIPAAIPNHSKTILVGEGSGYNLDLAGSGYRFTPSNGMEGWPNGGTPDRHGEYSNYLFVDGHIESLKLADAEALLKPRND